MVGVQNYAHVSPLKNTLNDARDISKALQSANFEVIEVLEPQNKRELTDPIRRYFNLINGQKDVMGLIYYSGHGIQVDGSNYLIPAQANLQLKADLDDQCLNMDFLMRVLEEAGNPLNVLIMDACRNNPFRSFTRSGENGLNMVNAPKGSYIVYATKPGSVASDGTGQNGLFTSKLLKYINEPGLNIEQMFKKVARDVSDESSESQRPWIASDYTGDFYFLGSEQTGTAQIPVKKAIATENIQDAKRGSSVSPALSNEQLLAKAVAFRDENKLVDFFETMLAAANNNHSGAQFEVGMALLQGTGTTASPESAAGWLRKAAVNGHLPAILELGKLYYYGEGLNRDFSVAFQYYSKAAAVNNAEGLYLMGTMQLLGRGTEKNESDAVRNFIRAAELGNVDAQRQLGQIYLMGGDKIRKNHSEAVKWFKKAAAQGDSASKNALTDLGM